MKKLFASIVAAAALAAGAPSMAQAHDYQGQVYDDDDWNNGGDTYDEFNQEYRHIWQGIQHGLEDGSYSRREASYFYRRMQMIRQSADWQYRSGYFNPQQIQYQLERLHEQMHVAHERGHERLDRYSDWNNDRGDYGYYGRRW